MAIGVIWQPDIDQQAYDAARERLVPRAAEKGMTFHAGGQADGGWRIIEVWDSREGLERFIEEDLDPVLNELTGGQAPSPRPESVFEISYQGP